MCILLVSTAHPEYPFILLFNRDEFLTRPTARASWWHPDRTPPGAATTSESTDSSSSSSPASSAFTSNSPHDILSGRDLVRPTHGTWLGITRSGRISALTNICESSDDAAYGSRRSRGEAPLLFLDSNTPTDTWIKKVVEQDGFDGIGGLSLFCCEKGGMGVVSNGDKNARVEKRYEVDTPAKRGTFGVSNSEYTRPWPKVAVGTDLLEAAVADALLQTSSAEITQEEGKKVLVDKLFEVLGTKGPWPDRESDVRLKHLKGSVFIPEMHWHEHVLDEMRPTLTSPLLKPHAHLDGLHGLDGIDSALGEPAGIQEIEGNTLDDIMEGTVTEGEEEQEEIVYEKDKRYGTKEQTVIIVDKSGHATFVERTLHDGERRLGEEERDRVFEWDIEGWAMI